MLKSKTSEQDITAPETLSRKGAQRREALLDAALRIIARDGHHQLSLRTVAREANGSHGSVAYYFGSRDALMCAAMEYAGAYLAETSAKIIPDLERSADNPKQFAGIVARYNNDMLISDRSMGIVVYELNLAAARESYLRPILYKWGKVHAELYRTALLKLGSKDPASDYTFLLHTMSGLLVAQLSLPGVERVVASIASTRKKATR